jgi:hypothetical protein
VMPNAPPFESASQCCPQQLDAKVILQVERAKVSPRELDSHALG